jgi:hypothetical protein
LSIKTAVKAIFAPDVIGRLESKFRDAEFEALHAKDALADARIESGGDETGAVQKAREAFSIADRNAEELGEALKHARNRKATQDAAEAAEKADKEAKARAAKRDAAIKRATDAADEAQELMVTFADAVREAIDAERELASYFDADEFGNQFSATLQALPLCVQHHLKFVGTFTGAGLGFDEAKARWSRYFPHSILERR